MQQVGQWNRLSLTRHLRVHTSEKPFTQKCNVAFARPYGRDGWSVSKSSGRVNKSSGRVSKYSGRVSKSSGVLTKSSGAVTKVLRSSYKSVPEQLVSLLEELVSLPEELVSRARHLFFPQLVRRITIKQYGLVRNRNLLIIFSLFRKKSGKTGYLYIQILFQDYCVWSTLSHNKSLVFFPRGLFLSILTSQGPGIHFKGYENV